MFAFKHNKGLPCEKVAKQLSPKANFTGFTLIELLGVISIIGLLSSVVLASLNSARAKARNAVRMSDLRQMNNAVQLYMSDHNGSPPTSAGWSSYDAPAYLNAAFFTTNFVTPGYISKWPTDPTPVSSRLSTDAGYLYYSNGTEYKILIYNTVEGGAVSLTSSLSRWGGGACGYGAESDYALNSSSVTNCW